MPLISIWDYLRERTRNAVLAGIQDALEVAEQNDQASSQYEAAMKLRNRLSAASLTEAGSPAALPMASPGDGAGESDVDDLIDSRLDGVLTTTEEPGPEANGQPHPARRKRGRPRKDASR